MMRPVHPGEVLREQIEELSMSARQLASHLRVPANRITELLNGERGLTADTALRLSRFFGTTAEFWLALQSNYDLRKAELEAKPLAKIIPINIARPLQPRPSVARSSTYAAREVGAGRFLAKVPARAKAPAAKAKKKAAAKVPRRRLKKARP